MAVCASTALAELPRLLCVASPFDRLALRLGFAMRGIFNPSGMKAQADCLALTYQQTTSVFILITISRETLTYHLDLAWGKGALE